MADLLICTPEALLPDIPCLICGRSKHELLAAFDAFLCTALNQADCSASAVLSHAQPYMDYSQRELTGAAAYLWLVFLLQVAPEVPTDEQAMAQAVSPFLPHSELEILAMQLWLLCAMTLGLRACTPTDLINGGRCYCLSIKELLAIRVYLLGIFVNNFVVVNMDPTVLRQHVDQNLGSFPSSALEAAMAWAECQVYNAGAALPA